MPEASEKAPNFPVEGMPGYGRAMVERLDPRNESGWDAGLEHFPGATFFHSAAWAAVLQNAYGFQPCYFVLRIGGGMAGLLPLMEVDSWLSGRRGISLPFTDECATLSPTAGDFALLWTQALAHAATRGWKYLESRGGREGLGDVLPSQSFFSHRLNLRQSEEELWAGLGDSVRRAVRKGGRSGLTVEPSQTLEALSEFYSLHVATRRRQGVPAQPWRFFREIHRHILASDRGQVVLVRSEGAPIAGAVFFHFGRTATYKYGASAAAGQSLRANNLLFWDAIERYARNGYVSLDFGRTALENAGLRRFKLGWGATERRIDYVRRRLPTGEFVTAGKGPGIAGLGLGRFLPPQLFQWIGSALYKHVA